MRPPDALVAAPGSPSGSASSSPATRSCRSCSASRCGATPSGPTCSCRTCWASTCPQSRPSCTAHGRRPRPPGAGAARRPSRPRRAVVLGYAETATGLGHSVADGLGVAPYLHSTRRPVARGRAGGRLRGGAQPRHLAPAAARGPGPARRRRAAGPRRRRVLHRQHRPQHHPRPARAAIPRERYVVVALVDMRSAADRAALRRVRRPSSAPASTWSPPRRARSGCPTDVLDRGQALVAEHEPRPDARGRAGRGARRPAPRGSTSAGPPACRTAAGTASRRAHRAAPGRRPARHGGAPARGAARRRPPGAGARLRGADVRAAAPGPRSWRRAAAAEVRFSTTTRSPVLAVDDPGYAIRTRLVFPAHDDPGRRTRRALRVQRRRSGGFDAIVAVVDSAADTPALHAPDGLLARLAAHTGRACCSPSSPRTSPTPAVHRKALPHAARAPARPRLLLVRRPTRSAGCCRTCRTSTLEAPTEEREEAIQSGGAHYAESLPVEYQPSAAVPGSCSRPRSDASAARIAEAVGAVTEIVLAERGPRAPCSSRWPAPARPVGVLMRRWAPARARPRPAALRRLHRARPRHRRQRAALAGRPPRPGRRRVRRRLDRQGRHHPRTRRRAQGVRRPRALRLRPGDRGARRPRLLRADLRHPRGLPHPLRLPQLHRLRADIAHRAACRPGRRRTTSTARSSTANSPAPTSPRTSSTRSRARFDEVADAVAATRPRSCSPPTATPTWEGWAAVERISEEYGIHDVNLVKPGVGETTRVLLRRVPVEDPRARRTRAPTSTTCGCSPSSAACPSRRSPNSPTPASG